LKGQSTAGTSGGSVGIPSAVKLAARAGSAGATFTLQGEEDIVSDDIRTTGWKAFWDRGGFWKALLVPAVYLALYLGTGLVLSKTVSKDVHSDEVLDTARNVFLGVALAIAIGIVFQLIFGASIKWLGELFGRQPELSRSWWMWIPPLVLLASNIMRFAGADYTLFDTNTVLMILFTGLCVGVAEELLTRGFVVNLMRRGGYKEWTVMFVSALTFALLHSANLLSGHDIKTVGGTIAYTFFFGICMYLTLRVTGSLIWPILLHASTDPSAMLATGGIDKTDTGGSTDAGLGELGMLLGNVSAMAMGLIFLWFVRGQVDRLAFVGSTPYLAAKAVESGPA
jgi:membrane protease YdiL (CAAX protease family)